MFSTIIIHLNKQKDGLHFLHFLAVIWIGTKIVMLQGCVFKIKIAIKVENFPDFC